MKLGGAELPVYPIKLELSTEPPHSILTTVVLFNRY